MFGRIYLWSCLVLDFCLLGVFCFVLFLITDSVSLLGIYLFIFSISSWFSLGRLYVSRNLSVFSRLSSLLVYNYSQQSLMVLCVSVVSVVLSPLSFLICLFGFSLFFFLMSLAKGLSILFIFSKNQHLVSLIFYIIFLVSILFIPSLIFIISFLLLSLFFYI